MDFCQLSGPLMTPPVSPAALVHRGSVINQGPLTGRPPTSSSSSSSCQPSLSPCTSFPESLYHCLPQTGSGYFQTSGGSGSGSGSSSGYQPALRSGSRGEIALVWQECNPPSPERQPSPSVSQVSAPRPVSGPSPIPRPVSGLPPPPLPVIQPTTRGQRRVLRPPSPRRRLLVPQHQALAGALRPAGPAGVRLQLGLRSSPGGAGTGRPGSSPGSGPSRGVCVYGGGAERPRRWVPGSPVLCGWTRR